MRHKKKLLLYCADEDRLGRMAFILRQGTRYAVTTCRTRLEVAATLECRYAAALLIRPAPEVVGTIKAAQIDCKVLAYGWGGALTDELGADVFMLESMPMADLLETLKTLTIDIRGPKPGTPSPLKGKKIGPHDRSAGEDLHISG